MFGILHSAYLRAFIEAHRSTETRLRGCVFVSQCEHQCFAEGMVEPMPFIQIRDCTELFYVNTGSATPMVFVASAWLNSRMWDFQMRRTQHRLHRRQFTFFRAARAEAVARP